MVFIWQREFIGFFYSKYLLNLCDPSEFRQNHVFFHSSKLQIGLFCISSGQSKQLEPIKMDDMESHGYSIEWVQADDNQQHAIICESRSDDIIEENDDIDEDEYLVGEEIIPSTEIITISNSLDQIAAENLIYMAQDGSVAVMGDLIEEQVEQADNADYNEQQYFECQVTEEVITDDWVQQQGGER